MQRLIMAFADHIGHKGHYIIYHIRLVFFGFNSVFNNSENTRREILLTFDICDLEQL